MTNPAKYIACLLIACSLAAMTSCEWLRGKPHIPQVIRFVESNQQVINRAGTIHVVKVVHHSSVQGSVSIDGKITPRHSDYRVWVRGSRAAFHVTVERHGSQDERGILRIASINGELP